MLVRGFAFFSRFLFFISHEDATKTSQLVKYIIRYLLLQTKKRSYAEVYPTTSLLLTVFDSSRAAAADAVALPGHVISRTSKGSWEGQKERGKNANLSSPTAPFGFFHSQKHGQQNIPSSFFTLFYLNWPIGNITVCGSYRELDDIVEIKNKNKKAYCSEVHYFRD